MKVSLFNNFGAKNSSPVFESIAQGLSALGHTVCYHDNSADAAVIWSMLWTGRMRNNQQVYAEFANRPVIVAEVGMIQRNHTWKLGLGGTTYHNYPAQTEDSDRANKLGIQCREWRNTGSKILIACQRTDSQQWQGQPRLDIWLTETVNKIRQHSDRPIVVRTHPRGQAATISGCLIEKPQQIQHTYDDFDYQRSLSTSWAVVNYNSGPGSIAVINGVPAFVGKNSMAFPVANTDLSQIETPNKPDRTAWLNWLAHSEWTTDEIATGYPLQRLLNTLC